MAAEAHETGTLDGRQARALFRRCLPGTRLLRPVGSRNDSPWQYPMHLLSCHLLGGAG
jgi:hypothetical protein